MAAKRFKSKIDRWKVTIDQITSVEATKSLLSSPALPEKRAFGVTRVSDR